MNKHLREYQLHINPHFVLPHGMPVGWCGANQMLHPR